MGTIFKPMLAGAADLEKLRFPLLASAKLDGVRAMIIKGRVMSRSLKPIPNMFVQEMFGIPALEGLDGELIYGDPRSKSAYRDTVSVVMSDDKPADAVSFFVFDSISAPTTTYKLRMERNVVRKTYPDNVTVLPQHYVMDLAALLALETKMLDAGYEGLILRDPAGFYKYGRSTTNEGWLLKLKRMVTSEAEIIGFVERQHNANEATVNELGRTARSSHQENKIGRGDLGALQGRDLVTGVEFDCGTGFSDAERAHIWNHRPLYLGKLFSYDHFPIGVKDKPRHPSYKGIRDKIDTDLKAT